MTASIRMRQAAAGATCAAEPCAADAVTETLHRPDRTIAVWVPLCLTHSRAVGLQRVEYIVELHGFLPVVPL